MKKTKHKAKWFEERLYLSRYAFFFEKEPYEKEIMRLSEHKHTVMSSGETTFFDVDEERVILIYVDTLLEYSDFLSLLVHEVIHAKQAMFKAIGEKEIGAEVEAYLTQALFLDGFNEYKRFLGECHDK